MSTWKCPEALIRLRHECQSLLYGTESKRASLHFKLCSIPRLKFMALLIYDIAALINCTALYTCGWRSSPEGKAYLQQPRAQSLAIQYPFGQSGVTQACHSRRPSKLASVNRSAVLAASGRFSWPRPSSTTAMERDARRFCCNPAVILSPHYHLQAGRSCLMCSYDRGCSCWL